MYTADQIYRIIGFLVGNIFVRFCGMSIKLGYLNPHGNELWSIAY